MKVKYFSENFVSWLKSEITNNLESYEQNDFHEFVQECASKCDGIKTADLKLDFPVLSSDKSNAKDDAQNVRIVYSQLQNLSCSQASDERLWSYMTHVHNWSYMVQRWGVSKTTAKDLNNFIESRYFLKTNNSRWLIRNGMSRLWWFGYLTYSEEDQWALTDVLLDLQDIQAGLLERTYGRNRIVIKSVLRVLAENRSEIEEHLKNDYSDLKKGYQYLCKYVGLLCGTTLLDALSQVKIENVLKKRFLKK